MDSTQACTEGFQESLVACLYDECDKTERERVTIHVARCAACAGELEALRSVRGVLDLWEAPEPTLGFRLVADRDRLAPWWRRMLEPSWGLAAAAGLVLVVAVAIVSVEVRFDPNGVVLRMGWEDRSATSVSTSLEPADPMTGVSVDGRVPWHADLDRLEDELRDVFTREFLPASVTSAEADRSALLLEIQRLIEESERRQQQEVAVWFTEFAREFDMQRRADQQRFQQDLGALEGVTDYLVRVSQR